MDCFQKNKTDIEHRALLAWLQGVIILPTPLLFVTETHVGAERDEFLSYHLKRLFPRLYGRLLVGYTLPAAGAELYLCRALLAGASLDEETTRVEGVFTAAYRVEGSARSPVVEFVFIHLEAQVE
uniref:Uncharacterized protein n=1 Tax=Peronospora matthiolae TaxID=2874970 RepID=A0AAV1UGI2_9STRA